MLWRGLVFGGLWGSCTKSCLVFLILSCCRCIAATPSRECWISAMRPATREGLNPGLAAASRCTDRIVGDPASDYRHRLRGRRAAGTITLTELKLKPPPSSPRSAPPCDDIDALEQALLISIRTAGLKPGRYAKYLQQGRR